MPSDKQEVHRAGALKQTNKSHKTGRHRSKGAISLETKGKVNIKTITKKNKSQLNKEQRRHQAQQIRKNKREELLNKKRYLGGTAPFLICVLPMNLWTDVDTAMKLLLDSDSEALVNSSIAGITHITVPRFKQSFSFVTPSVDNKLAILDTLKVCDTVLLVISAKSGYEFGDELVDDWGRDILMSAFAQGLPTPVVTVTEIDDIPIKKQNEQKQNIQQLISKYLPDEKLIKLSQPTDSFNVYRKIGNQKPKRILYRDRRPHLISESRSYDEKTSTLKIIGYLRGAALSANELVYLPGMGSFQISQIDLRVDPFKPNPENVNKVTVLETADPSKQESLQSENIPDPLDAEQTFPTEEEINEAQDERKRKVKKVPKGWSDYQSAWIPDEYAAEVSGSDDDEDDDEGMEDAMSEDEEKSMSGSDYETIAESVVCPNDQQYDDEMDLNLETVELQKIKDAKLDAMFPDEINTPLEVPARVRFQKYRGLESYRTSPWDPKENLPNDYGRIFQFENFDRTRKVVMKNYEDRVGALVGSFISVHVKNVPNELWEAFKSTHAPLILFGLLPHENKMSAINVVLKRTGNHDDVIKSKDKLVFQCGCRRFIANPVFSQHTNGRKHKFERYFQANSTVVATFFAPIQYPPAPVLCYKEINGELRLVATGSLLSVNPDRIITKRIVLSGHLYKVHTRSAIVRFMFFNREDIMYFKPCKLRTKYGRIGHIKEPLGTHGHMKCVFDGQLKSQDTVLLQLYKRVFPKWTYEECIVSCKDNKNNVMET